MNDVLGIIGAGVLGQHIAHYAILTGNFSKIVFYDDTLIVGENTNNGVVAGSLNDINIHIANNTINFLLIGIGYNHMKIRESQYVKYNEHIEFPNIIHNSCYIDSNVEIGKGNILLPGCIVDKGTIIGNNNFFNPGVVIAHDNKIGNHNFFAPAVKNSGFVNIANKCFIGTGATIIDNINISDSIKVGAGAVVTKNINKSGLYYGVPAREHI